MIVAEPGEAPRSEGRGIVAPPAVVALYREAFAAFGTSCLWNRRRLEAPTLAQALAVARTLLNEGDMRCVPLASAIKAACRAAL